MTTSKVHTGTLDTGWRAVARVTTGAERQLAVEHWLLSTSPDAQQVRAQWRESPIALLSCGAVFAAVRIPALVVRAAAHSTDRDVIDGYLAEAALDGPVICDRYAGWYYALVPVGTARRWDVPDTVCLGLGSTLGVPRPGLSGADDVRVYWSVPMDSAGALCSAHAVSQLVMTGRYRAGARRDD
ncbi:hypothetical protein [Streptomyces xantholiticus]|uniref:Uncharacterized protein n=1 Tax=Streptomyces xantholiticus TaxID=68285 RepID=A0ABV1V2T1_9ACTN